MASDQTKAIIKASVRTLAQLVPIAGGAVAQAWSEFEGIQVNTRLGALEAQATTIKDQIEHMPDFSRLLEDTVEAVRRESDDRKQQVYPVFFLNLILQSPTLPPDERSFLLETLDTLTENDLEVLRKFQEHGWSRGDILTSTSGGDWAPVGVRSPVNAKYENLLEPAMISTAKLEARGIILPIPNEHAFISSGTRGDWYDIYRQRAWKLMPMGRKLLQTLTP